MSPIDGAGGYGEFEAFAASCSTRLLRAAYLLCGDRQAAEDLVQTTLMRTARHWRQARQAPEAYARAVLVNLARDQARRRRRRVEEVLTDEALRVGERRLVTDHATGLIDRDTILAALAALPQRQREVIVLRFFGDLSVAQTAAAIGASQGTVMSYTSRALSRLRELLGEQPERQSTSTTGEVHHDHR
ncbi:MAG: SigE family RNA polymerase sigma factor [Actinomycetota bacterium]|nr:SigE family RNA polymerase sigma factor [Actinomycetota bacterium]